MDVKTKAQYFADWFITLRLNHVMFAPDIHRLGRIHECSVDEDGIPYVIFKFDVKPYMDPNLNHRSSGAITTLVDWLTAVAAMGDPKFWANIEGLPNEKQMRAMIPQLGLSRNLDLKFFSDMHVGMDVYFKYRVLENTKRRSFFSVEIYDEDKKVYVEGHHDKIKLYKSIDAKI